MGTYKINGIDIAKLIDDEWHYSEHWDDGDWKKDALIDALSKAHRLEESLKKVNNAIGILNYEIEKSKKEG